MSEVAVLSGEERRALQAHARRALEAVDQQRGAREGECVWHTDHPPTWTPTTLKGLETRGLIEVRREWKDNFVRITTEGFAALTATTQDGGDAA